MVYHGQGFNGEVRGKIIKRTLSSSVQLKMLAVERKNLCFKHPFTCMIASRTSSGKIVLIRLILKHHKSLMYFRNDNIDKLKNFMGLRLLAKLI